jgi:hypothetical protein
MGHRSRGRLKDLVTAMTLFLVPSVFAALPFLLLFWLAQPKVLANPGMTAHKVLAATSLALLPDEMEPAQSGQRSEASPVDATQPGAHVDLPRAGARQRKAEKPAKTRDARNQSQAVPVCPAPQA